MHIVVAMCIYRWLANTPRRLYQFGLGWVLSHRVVQITHRGRKSGQIRWTILEVLHYDPQTQEVLVVSGWEGKTDWYRNIEHEPVLVVRTGRVHYQPVQEFLSPEEMAKLILTLFRQRPREAHLPGPSLRVDPDADKARLRARLETFASREYVCVPQKKAERSADHEAGEEHLIMNDGDEQERVDGLVCFTKNRPSFFLCSPLPCSSRLRATPPALEGEEVAAALGHVTKKGTPAIATTARYTQLHRE